jgi:formylglycine-generating enzyme required for sulfatase activity/serine/threonine protein kinase
MTAASLALAPGFVVDKLRIDRVLGQGTFGITYLVTDQVLDKSFALKEFLPQAHVVREEDGSLRPSSERAAEQFERGLGRFLHEGRTVAKLDHPNIVTVFRCFKANGTAYLLMPFYRGEALHKLLRRSGALSADEARALSVPLLNALEYIHANEVIHQDIKPANIYITESGEPILLDFGAAGQRRDTGSPPLSDLDRKLGSEGYAAAEQSESTGDIGPWTDIYGLAATLYRCITGQVPIAASQRRLALNARDPDPLAAPASLVSERDYEGILEAVSQGLAVDSGSRPQDVGDWRKHFTQKSGRETIESKFPAGIDREGREWLPLILLALFLATVTATAIYLFTAQSPDKESLVRDIPGGATEQENDKESYVSPEETSRWQAALEADTVYGYRLFMEDYPESIHNAQARVQLDVLEDRAWQEASADGSESAIEAYMDNFPAGRHEADALILLNEFKLAEAEAERLRREKEQREASDWDSARKARTLAAIDEFLSTWPDGAHVDAARELRRDVSNEINDRRAFEAASKLNTIEAHESYIAAFPRGDWVAAALEAIDQLTLRPGKTFRDCADCPTMVVIPAGSFWQGSEDSAPLALRMEKPRRMVTISESFAVGVFEITLAQWDRCVADGGCSTRPNDNGWGRGNRPVIMVSWNDAQEYAAWISKQTGQRYRLPSESEWEYFARAGEEGDWPGGNPAFACNYGNIAGSETAVAWQHDECSDGAILETLPVGSFKANAFGVHDVIGNVGEWTLDCMNLSYLDAPADGSAWSRGICSSRMTRGGSWITGTRDIRLPARFNLKTGDRNDFTGFRLVRIVEDQ